jgi:hypothetical protein
MHTTYYRSDPATIDAVTCGSTVDVARVREALAKAIHLSGRDIWTWKPGRLLALHDGGGRLRCTWADNQSMAKYARYLDLAWELCTGSDELEHELASAGT